MTYRWEDKNLAEKASAFFLTYLRILREEQSAAIAAASSAESTTPDGQSAAATDENVTRFHLGLDNLPEEYLPAQQFLKLHRIRADIKALVKKQLPETNDAIVAARNIVFWEILDSAYFFVNRLLLYLLCDRRFHPGRSVSASAIKILRIGNNEEEFTEYYDDVEDIFIQAKLYNIIAKSSKPNEGLTDALAILRDCGCIFFMTLGSIFPLNAISKCNMSFSMFMDQIGVSTSTECVAKLVNHMKTMQCAIEDWDAHGGAVSDADILQTLDNNNTKIQQLTEDVAELMEKMQSATKKVTNMDRRLSGFIRDVKKVIKGFVHLFNPLRPKPTPAEVANTLTPSDRYACLDNIKEPHRSQIKEVVDHTEKHPIVFKKVNEGDYTLANAVRDVWAKKHDAWSHLKGTFASAEDLKSACYNIRDRKNGKDPFYYQTDRS